MQNSGYRPSFGYFAAFISLGLLAASLGPALPDLAQKFGTTAGALGFLFTARSAGYLVSTLGSGWLYDRQPGHRILALTMAAAAIMLALTPLAPSLRLLVLVMAGTGMAEASIDVGGNTLLVWIYRKNVAPFMNALHFFFGFGAFLAPLIVGQSRLLTGEITAGFWLMGFLALPGVFWILRRPSPIHPAVQDNTSPEPIRLPLALLVTLCLTLYVGAEVAFGGWVFTYAKTRAIGTLQTAAWLNSAFWGALTAGRLISIPLGARFRPRTVIMTDLMICILALSLILLWPDSSAALWAGTIGLGLGMASIFPTTLTLAERRMTITSQVTSIFFIGVSGGAALLPWLIGQMFLRHGSLAVIWGVLGGVLAAVGAYAILAFAIRPKPALP